MNYTTLFRVYNGVGLGNTKEDIRAKMPLRVVILAYFNICFWFIFGKDKCTNVHLCTYVHKKLMNISFLEKNISTKIHWEDMKMTLILYYSNVWNFSIINF